MHKISALTKEKVSNQCILKTFKYSELFNTVYLFAALASKFTSILEITSHYSVPESIFICMHDQHMAEPLHWINVGDKQHNKNYILTISVFTLLTDKTLMGSLQTESLNATPGTRRAHNI
jgi:hypothetical protein